jgi:hypothetical protein
MLSMQSTIVASQEQVASKIDEEVAILGLKKGIYYSLDSVGVFVWDYIQQPHTLTEVCEAVMQEYDVEKAQCEQDMIEFFTDLLQHELVEVVGGSEA